MISKLFMRFMGSGILLWPLIIGILIAVMFEYDQQIGGVFSNFFGTIRNILHNFGINLPNIPNVNTNNQDFIGNIKNLMSQFKFGGVK